MSFLGKIVQGCCAGEIVRRFGRSSVGIPCFAVELEENEKFCEVCKEIWSEHEDNGFFVMDTASMPCAADFYESAKAVVLWNFPFMQKIYEYFSDQIQMVKDVLQGTDSELERD